MNGWWVLCHRGQGQEVKVVGLGLGLQVVAATSFAHYNKLLLKLIQF